MKKVIGIFIVMLLIATVFSVTGSKENSTISKSINNRNCECIINCNNGDRLDQEQSDYNIDENNQTWGFYKQFGLYAQSFVPKLPVLTRVDLYIFCIGNPMDLVISIRDDLEGEDLTYVNIEGALYEDNSWVCFDFADISVNPGETYYIIWNPDGNNLDHCYCWIFGSNDPYIQGKPWAIAVRDWEIMENDAENLGFFNIDFCFRTYGYSDPPSYPELTGSTSGRPGTEYEYSLVSTELDGDDIYYYIDWGDGDIEEWAGPFSSNVKQTFTHSWDEEGEYTVRAKAKDQYDFESDWTTLQVSMPKNKQSNNLILHFLENHPNLFQILKHIIY